jgi:hypothetical protein
VSSYGIDDDYNEGFFFYLGEPLVLQSSTKDIEVNDGDSVSLTCNAQGLLF